MQFPGPIRAVVGLLASAAEEAKHLPDRAIELPMLAVSSALQASLRAQQRYARLAARGDEVLNRRRPGDEPPAWATFDEPVSIEELRRGAVSAEQAQAASDLLDELLGTTEEPGEPAAKKAGQKAAGKSASPAASTAASKTASTAASPAKKSGPARKAPAATPAAKKAPAKRAADAGRNADRNADRNAGKNVSKPRHVAPSRFDAVGDSPDD